jgi:tripartite-type tricarboxylate transporter receptor subunit TctC
MWAWTAAYAPAGTPRPMIGKLNALVREAVSTEAYKALTKTTFGVPFPGTPEELAAFQASESKKWGEIVTIAGMKEP